MIDLNHIEEFVTFAKYLSITKAATALYTSKSTLSKHMRQLERDVGFALIDRSGPDFHLTQEGEIFFNAFSSVLSEYDDARDKCMQLQRQKRDALVVQEPSYQDVCALGLFSLMSQIKQRCPQVPVRYRRPQRHSIASDLDAKEVDIAIAHCAEKSCDGTIARIRAQQDVATRFISCDCIALWVNASHRFAAMEDVPIGELPDAVVLSPNDIYSPMRAIFQEYCKEHGVKPRFRVIESESPMTFLTSQYPDDVYIIPASAHDDLRIRSRGEMVVVPLDGGGATFCCHAIIRRDRLAQFPEIEDLFL